MKTTKRNVALAIVALFSGQLLISCSGTKMQWSKNEVQKETFASSQFNHKAVEEKTPVLNKELNFNAQAEVEAPVLASISNEIPVSVKKSTTVNTNVVKEEVTKFEKKSDVKKSQKQPTDTKAPDAKGRSQLIALILCLVGGLGIHRFYLGYIGIGILQLLMTLTGVLAIVTLVWVIIDAINIYNGKLKPKDGEYAETIDK